MTERAQLAKAQAVAVELHALLSLDPGRLGLQTLLERKGALLERRTRVQSAFRRDAETQVAEPGAVGRFFESPITRAERDVANRRSADDRELLREYEAAVQERASLPRTAANQTRIADLDTRIQVMQQRMQMSEMASRSENQNLTQSDLRDIMRKSGSDPQKITEAVEARSSSSSAAASRARRTSAPRSSRACRSACRRARCSSRW